MIINVTQDHIDNVLPDGCPIQVALDEIGIAYPFLVGAYFIQLNVERNTHWIGSAVIEQPPEVAPFVNDFDCGMPVPPINFELPIEPYLKEVP